MLFVHNDIVFLCAYIVRRLGHNLVWLEEGFNLDTYLNRDTVCADFLLSILHADAVDDSEMCSCQEREKQGSITAS